MTGGLPFHVEILKLGSGDDATQWTLMTFGKKSKKQKNKYIQDHTRVQYITIFVEEVAPIIERCKKHSLKFLGDAPLARKGGRYFTLIQPPPDGTFVELIGPMNKESAK